MLHNPENGINIPLNLLTNNIFRNKDFVKAIKDSSLPSDNRVKKMNTSPNADVIATRDLDLRRRLERLATLDERKPAQMTRILLRRAIEQKEEELGLPPLEVEAA